MSTALAPRPPEVKPSPTPRPPMTWTKRLLLAVVAIAVALTLLSAFYLKFNLFVLIDGIANVVNLVERMLPVRMDDPGRIAELALETVLMALLGTVLATILSVPLAFLAARNTTPHPWVLAVARGVITFCRAVPDLVFAIIFVRAMGLGVLPGVLALGIHSIGMLGKLFADAIEEIDEGPREAVRATGAGPIKELISGVIPQVVPAWIGVFVYRIDINLRTSVVLGFVGAGGIGFALQASLRGLAYDKALGMVLVILVILAVMEFMSVGIRRLLLRPSPMHPEREKVARYVLGGLLVGSTAFAMWDLAINPLDVVMAIPQILEVSTKMFPPDFGAVGSKLWEAVLQTLAIGMVATAIGIVLSVPLGLLAARNVAPHPSVAVAARTIILLVRSIPELILAVIFVAAVGLGPIAGVCALGIGSIGFLGKLVSDAVEEIDEGPVEAVRSVGGGWWKTLISGIIPQAVPNLVGSTLYMLDVNIRTSTVLGIVGAGGVGFLLYESVRTLNFEFAGAIITIIFVVVYLIERLSGWIRAQVA